MTVNLQMREGFFENGDVLALATPGWPHDHQPVSHADHLVKLDSLRQEDGHLQTVQKAPHKYEKHADRGLRRLR